MCFLVSHIDNECDRDLSSVVHDYGAIPCRKLVSNIMHYLPTEMRIFSMEYLTLESKPIEPGKRPSRYHLNRDIIRDALQNTFTGSENKHHFDWKYTGYMTHDIAATWFQTTILHFDDSLALDLYFRDIWLGCQSLPSTVPADHLRHMTVELRGDMRDYNRKKQ